MDDGGGNGGGSFKVKHGSNAAEVTDVHEAGAGEVGDVVGEREMRIESDTKITDRASEVKEVEDELSERCRPICGVVVRGLRLHRAILRCVLQETAPRPWFGVRFYYSSLAWVFSNFQYAPPLTLGRIYTPFFCGSTFDPQRSKTYFFFLFFLFYRRI